jgi:hypothetical protein
MYYNLICIFICTPIYTKFYSHKKWVLQNHSSILQTFPCLDDGLIHDLLKPRDLVPEGIGFAQREKLGEKCIGALLPGWHCLLIGIEPLFHLS